MQSYAGRCLIAAGLLVIGGGVVNAILFRRPPELAYAVNFAPTPLEIGDLRGRRVSVEQRVFEYLGADAMDEMIYQGPEGAQARLSLVYGRDWRSVHNPLACFQQQGWLVDRKEPVELPAPPGCPHAGPLRGTLLRVHKAEMTMLSLYVFAHQGGTEADFGAHVGAVTRTPRGAGGMLLHVSVPMAGDDEDPAQGRLRQVLDAVYVPTVAFWYETGGH